MAKAHRTAAILSVGDELTLGQKLDTNSQWVAQRLADAGVLVAIKMTVPDDLGAIAARFRELSRAHDVVISTGGLGPTLDDLTRGALAEAMGEGLVEDAVALAEIRAWFAGAGRVMAEANRVQALRPVSAVCLSNEMGTAPGLGAVCGGADVFCLPGPPREMRPMFERCVAPALRPDRVVVTRVLQTVGLGESAIADLLGGLMDRGRNPLVGTTASGGVVSCRLRYEGTDRVEAERLLNETDDLVRERIGASVFAEGERSLAETVLGLLRRRGERVATVESCTGGLIGQMLTDVPGAADAYVGGWVTYTNEMKMREVGVEPAVFAAHGAVSEACCRAMAEGGLARSGADYALAVTGVAGPSGGSEEKPVGTVWVGLASRAGTRAERFLFKGDRQMVRLRSAVAGLAMLWGEVIGTGH